MPQTPTLRRPGGMPTPEELELLRRKQLEQVQPILPQVGGGMPRPSAIEAPLPPAGMDVSALPMASAIPTQDIPLPPAPPQGTRLSPAPRLPQAQEWTRGPEGITEVRARFAGAQVPGAPPLTPQERQTPTYQRFNLPAQPRPVAPAAPVTPPPVAGGPVRQPMAPTQRPTVPGAFDFRTNQTEQMVQRAADAQKRNETARTLQARTEAEAQMATPYRAPGTPLRPGETAPVIARVPRQQPLTREERQVGTEGFLGNLKAASREQAQLQAAEAKRQARIERTAIPQSIAGRTFGPTTGQAVNQAIRAFEQTVGSNIVKGLGVASGQQIVAEAGIKGAQDIESWMRQRFPINTEEERFLQAALPQGLGSALGFGAASLLGGTSAGMGALGGASLSGAMIGALNNAASTYDDAINKGASRDTALQAVRVGNVIGALEGVMGLESRFGRIFKPGPLMERAVSIFGEGAEEIVSQFLNNANAKIVSGYDPDRALSEGLVQSGLTGIAVASLFEAPGAVGAKLRERLQATIPTDTSTGGASKTPDALSVETQPQSTVESPLEPSPATGLAPPVRPAEIGFPRTPRSFVPGVPSGLQGPGFTRQSAGGATTTLPQGPPAPSRELAIREEVGGVPEPYTDPRVRQYEEWVASGGQRAPLTSAVQKMMRRPVPTRPGTQPQVLPPEELGPGVPAGLLPPAPSTPPGPPGALPPGSSRRLIGPAPEGGIPSGAAAPSVPPSPAPTPPTFRSARTFREVPGVEAPPLSEGEEGKVQFPEGIKGAEPIVPNPPLQRKAFVEIGAQIQDSIDEEVARRPEDEDPEKIKVKNVKERPDAAIAEAVFYSPNVPEVLIPRYGGSPTDLAENSLERVWGGIGREMAGIIGKPDLSLRDMTQSQIVTDAHWKRWAEIYGRRAGLLQGEIQGLIDTARGGFEKEGLNTEGAGAFLRRDDVRQAMGAPKKANSSETAKGVYDRVKAQMGRVFGLEAAGLQQFSLTHVPAEGWRIWAKLQGLDNTEKYGVEVYEGKKMTSAMAALERAIYRAQTWSQREDTQREIQRKITPDEKILDIETPISEWYGQKYQPKTKGEGVRTPSLPPAARERRTGGTGAFIRGEAFERQGKESGVTIGRPQGPPVPRRPIGLLPERTEERPVEAAPPTPPVAPEPTPSPTQAPVTPTAPPATSTETRAKKKKKTEGAVPPATTPAASEVRQGEVGMKLGPGEVVRTLSGRLTTPFPKWKTFSDATAKRITKSIQQWLLANALAEAEARGDEFNARTFRQNLDDLTGSKNLAPQAPLDSAEMYLFDWQPPVFPRITKPLVQPTAEPKERTAETAPAPAAAEAVPEPTTAPTAPAPSAPEARGASEKAQAMFDTLDGLIKGKTKDKASAMRAQYGDEGFRAYFITSKFETIVEEAEENGKLTKKCP